MRVVPGAAAGTFEAAYSSTGNFEAVLIVGAGLIGASVGLALSRIGAVSWLIDQDPSIEQAASQRGAGQIWTPAELAQFDLVVVAVSPDYTADRVAWALAEFPQATVTDVASVKTPVLAELRRRGIGLERYVGGHPLAGREVSGPAAARSDLFDDRVWVVAPTSDSRPEAISRVVALVTSCGATPVELSAEGHDRAVALTSHTPQVLASVMAARLVEAEAGDAVVSGPGLRDLTRIAASNPDLWTQILRANADQIRKVLTCVIDDLKQVTEALAKDTPELNDVLRNVIHRGNLGHQLLPTKHGLGLRQQYAVLAVVVADKPGELGRLFQAAGKAGVNLEDVRIEHTIGRLKALVELSVRESDLELLRDALQADGWTLRG